MAQDTKIFDAFFEEGKFTEPELVESEVMNNPTDTSSFGKIFKYAKSTDGEVFEDSYSGRKKENIPSPETPDPSWSVTEMYPRHEEVARRLLLGEKNCKIAEDLGLTQSHVSLIKNSPVVKEKLALMGQLRDASAVELSQKIASLGTLAFLRVQEALETGEVAGKPLSGKDILSQAESVINHSIGKATQKVATVGVTARLSVEDINTIKAKAKELSGQ